MVPMRLVHMADIARKADIRMKIYNTIAKIICFFKGHYWMSFETGSRMGADFTLRPMYETKCIRCGKEYTGF